MRLFEEVMKARQKSQYAIGKHPNSHRRKNTAEEAPAVSGTQRLFLETVHYRTGGRFRQPTAKWAVKTGHATYDFDTDSYKLTDKGRKAIQEKPADDADTRESITNVNKPYHPKARAARKEALRDLIKHQPDARERGIGIDLDTGERIYDTMGTAGRGNEWDADFEKPHVPMADAIRTRANRKRTLEYHTHPGQHDTGPSEGDWSVFMNASQMHEMRVVARDRVFSMQKTGRFYKLPRKVRTGFQGKRRWEEMVEEEFQSQRHDTVDQMIDAANKRMASEFGIKYSVATHRKRNVTKMFDEIFKARQKSQYAIGKHPNSHKRIGKRPGTVDTTPTSEELTALDSYQSYSFFAVNSSMRMGKGNPNLAMEKLTAFKTTPDHAKQDIRNTISSLKSLIDKKAKPLSKDEVFYRSIPEAGALFAPATAMNVARDKHFDTRRRAEKDMDGHLQKLQSKDFVDHGFISVTALEKQAMGWAGRRGYNPVLFRITVPKGTKVFDPSEVASQKDYIVKKERILAPGTKFRVKKVGVHSTNPNFRIVDMEVVP